MSSALKRRFNIVVLPAPADMQTEIDIVKTRVAQMSDSFRLNSALPDDSAFEKVVTIFRELRNGQTLDGQIKLKTTSGVQLGGGTDIKRSVAYCSELVSKPEKTTMFIVTTCTRAEIGTDLSAG